MDFLRLQFLASILTISFRLYRLLGTLIAIVIGSCSFPVMPRILTTSKACPCWCGQWLCHSWFWKRAVLYRSCESSHKWSLIQRTQLNNFKARANFRPFFRWDFISRTRLPDLCNAVHMTNHFCFIASARSWSCLHSVLLQCTQKGDSVPTMKATTRQKSKQIAADRALDTQQPEKEKSTLR